MINNIINKFVEEFEALSKGSNPQEALNKAGIVLDLTTSFPVKEQKIIHSNKDMKKHIGNLTSWALMLLVDNEISYTDEIGTLLNIASFDYREEFNDEQLEMINGLAYKYDKYFKGDMDFYPSNKEIQKILNI